MARIQERYGKDDSRLAVTAQFLGRREQARQSRLLSKSAAGLTAGTATVTPAAGEKHLHYSDIPKRLHRPWRAQGSSGEPVAWTCRAKEK